ncbi:MAG: glycoside hydrolase family 13 protein [Oscillospiraceae bacterium]|nr:glycoside hydrolase family 13 protein [Oscillospiraceae bacterium]
MDTVISQDKRICSKADGLFTEGAVSRVWFGGSYQEHWSADYTLLVSYRDRRQVDAAWRGGRWHPSGGDAAWCETLLRDDCPAFTRRYFEAAATAWCAAQDCLRRGLTLEKLYESFPEAGSKDPIAAAELLRLLMDDCGLKLETALPLVRRCCGAGDAAEDELAALEPLQPRTAQVARLLREKSPLILTALHDTREAACRRPFGAARCGEEVFLGFRLASGRVWEAALLLRGEGLREERPMARTDEGFGCSFYAPATAGALRYCFRIDTPEGTRYLGPDGSGLLGFLFDREPEGFRLTVYEKEFDTPAWFRRSVMYQIFPDRFAFSDDGTAERGIEYHRALGQTPEKHASRDEPPRWQPRSFEKSYSPDDFYGGTLKGIEEKLPYLKALGVSCLYLNPIVEARSNHRYDTADYRRVDPILGTEEDFERLCRAAAEQGMRVVLDGVFSHTGADSRYFNRYGHYPERGACQGKDSPYYPWYDFKRFPDDYRCWWGFKDLPEVEERNPVWQDFVVSGDDSVVKLWLRRGAAGWRLDVADELPDEVLALIRRAAKEEKPDALVLGEVWEDPVVKESYGKKRRYALGGALDTVMNYPLRTALLDFMHRRVDAYGLRDRLLSQQLNYPQPMYYALMNLLGSHDVERIRTALSTPVALKTLPREAQLAFAFDAAERAAALGRERLCAALQFALPGVPSVYYGDEQGMDGACDPFNRAPFREGDGELCAYYAALAARRNGSDALRCGEAVIAACSREVLTVLRYVRGGRGALGEAAEDGAWLLAVNRSDEEQPFEAELEAVGGGMLRGVLAPFEARWIEL